MTLKSRSDVVMQSMQFVGALCLPSVQYVLHCEALNVLANASGRKDENLVGWSRQATRSQQEIWCDRSDAMGCYFGRTCMGRLDKCCCQSLRVDLVEHISRRAKYNGGSAHAEATDRSCACIASRGTQADLLQDIPAPSTAEFDAFLNEHFDAANRLADSLAYVQAPEFDAH